MGEMVSYLTEMAIGEMVSCIPNIPRNELDIVDMITL